MEISTETTAPAALYSHSREPLASKYSDLLPPTADGVSEIRMEIVEDNPTGPISELKKIIKKGKMSFRVLSET